VTQTDAAIRFELRGGATDPGPSARSLVDAGVYDIRRVAVGPGQSHGPGRHRGDACVLVLDGTVAFTVDDRSHALGAGDLLWVRAGASRGFVAGDHGALLLALHLPAASREAPPGASPGTAADEAVLAQVVAHHARMSARLDALTLGVAGAGEAAALRSALSSLVAFWRSEVLPHAAAEEATIYAEAREAAGALIRALVLEHADLRARAEALALLAGQAVGTAAQDPDSTPASPPDLRSRAAMQAAAAAALFHVHARKENEIVLPALVAAGRPLPPILAAMERAFSAAKADAG